MNRPTRILQVVQSLDFGGLERVVINLVRNLDPTQFRCDVLCLRHAGRFADELQDAGCAVSSFDMGRGKSLGVPRRLAAFIRDGSYDIVQTHDTTPLLYVALAKMFFPRFRHIYTEHSGIYSCLPRHRSMTALALLSVDHAVMVSKNLLAYYADHFRIYKPPMSFIYNGLDFPPAPHNARESVFNEFSFPPDACVVGTAVRFYPQKGLRYLVGAMPQVLRNYPETRFLLVGDGVERAMLKQMVDDHGIRERVVFAGFRRDIARLIGAMDVYVLPSLWEGLPLALIEALMAKKAVVATSVGGNPELIENDVSGFIVPPGDVETLADRLRQLLGSETMRRSMAERGEAFVRERFALQRMVESYQSLYLDIAGK